VYSCAAHVADETDIDDAHALYRREPDAGFGITSDLFDRAFGTRPAAQSGGSKAS
jgi:hypothetical protein